MTHSERDPVVRRAIEDLKRLPDVDPLRMRRVVEAAAVARVTPADDEAAIPMAGRRPRWALRIGMLAAAAVIGFFARDAWRSRALIDATQGYDTPASISMRPAANVERELVPVPQPFVFNSRSARSAHAVAVVGDFNGWNRTTSPMVRSTDGSMWSATIPILPGRHTYGFMVDDSLFVLDPSSPKARDADLGTDISVLMVGRP